MEKRMSYIKDILFMNYLFCMLIFVLFFHYDFIVLDALFSHLLSDLTHVTIIRGYVFPILVMPFD